MWRTSILVLAVVGCSRPKLMEAKGVLKVEPASIEVSAFAGFPIESSVSLRNTGRATLQVHVKTTAGLTAPAVVEVEAGQSVALKFGVRAETAGPVAEGLSFTAEEDSAAVAVTGEIKPAPSCGDPGACRKVHFDGTACVTEVLPDDTTCTNSCLLTASCHAGTCLGTARSCDDGNRCTVDGCDPRTGCTHAALECSGENLGPCDAPICDLVLGCTSVMVADGTLCGPNDCTTASICLSGMCQAAIPPEGSQCSDETPCRTAGRCVSKACVATDHPTGIAFELIDTATTRRELLNAVSPNGFFFAEEVTEGQMPFVVAYDANGRERWRSPSNVPPQQTRLLFDVARNQVIVNTLTTVSAINNATGARKWFVDLSDEMMKQSKAARGLSTMTLLPAAERLVVAFSLKGFFDEQAEDTVWTFGLDLTTGAQHFMTQTPGFQHGSVMGTATEEIIASVDTPEFSANKNVTTSSRDSNGVLRWQVTQPYTTFQEGNRAQILFDGQAWLVSGDLFTGSPVATIPRVSTSTGMMTHEPVPSAGTRALLANANTLYFQSPDGVTAWDLTQHKARWTTPGVFAFSAYLTNTGGVLATWIDQASLISATGALQWTCPMDFDILRNTVLVNGQLVTRGLDRIVGYTIGPVKVSPTGWSVTGSGNPEATHRAR